MTIIKIVATRWRILRLKCTKFDFGWGYAPDPAGLIVSDAVASNAAPTASPISSSDENTKSPRLFDGLKNLNLSPKWVTSLCFREDVRKFGSKQFGAMQLISLSQHRHSLNTALLHNVLLNVVINMRQSSAPLVLPPYGLHGGWRVRGTNLLQPIWLLYL